MQFKKSFLQYAFLFVLFVISYVIVWLIGAVWLNRWDSPLHFLIPIPAFFLAFWLLGWVESEFKVNAASLWWLLVIIVIGLAAFGVSQFFYWCNGFTNIQSEDSSCSASGAQGAIDFLGKQWVELLLRDGYFYFLIMVLLAWGARLVWSAASFPQTVRK